MIKIAPARENRFALFDFDLPKVSASCTVTSTEKKKKCLLPKCWRQKPAIDSSYQKKNEVMRGL